MFEEFKDGDEAFMLLILLLLLFGKFNGVLNWIRSLPEFRSLVMLFVGLFISWAEVWFGIVGIWVLEIFSLLFSLIVLLSLFILFSFLEVSPSIIFSSFFSHLISF